MKNQRKELLDILFNSDIDIFNMIGYNNSAPIDGDTHRNPNYIVAAFIPEKSSNIWYLKIIDYFPESRYYRLLLKDKQVIIENLNEKHSKDILDELSKK